MIYKDQLNRTITLQAIPRRIISLVPSQTELLVDLGLESSIVGVTKFCVHPEKLRKTKTIVGGTKKVHFEKIASLNPDIIICNKEENTKAIVDNCAKIAPVWVSDIKTIPHTLEMIAQLGSVFNCIETSQKLIEVIEDAEADFKKFILAKPHTKVAYCIWKNPYMVAGANTFINTLLKLNNFDNIFKNKNGRYPEVTISEMKKADVVLLSTEPYPFKEDDLAKIKNELQTEVRLVDGEYFSWYGSRIIKAFKYFKSIH